MKEAFSIEAYLKFNAGELPPEEQRKMAEFLSMHQSFQEILEGINDLAQHLKSKDQIPTFLARKKEKIHNNLFKAS